MSDARLAKARVLLADVRTVEREMAEMVLANEARRSVIAKLLLAAKADRVDNGTDEAVLYRSMSYEVRDIGALLAAVAPAGRAVLDRLMPRKPAMGEVRRVLDGEILPPWRGAVRKCCTKKVERKLRVQALKKQARVEKAA
jgi:hypothetical protein